MPVRHSVSRSKSFISLNLTLKSKLTAVSTLGGLQEYLTLFASTPLFRFATKAFPQNTQSVKFNNGCVSYSVRQSVSEASDEQINVLKQQIKETLDKEETKMATTLMAILSENENAK